MLALESLIHLQYFCHFNAIDPPFAVQLFQIAASSDDIGYFSDILFSSGIYLSLALPDIASLLWENFYSRLQSTPETVVIFHSMMPELISGEILGSSLGALEPKPNTEILPLIADNMPLDAPIDVVQKVGIALFASTPDIRALVSEERKAAYADVLMDLDFHGSTDNLKAFRVLHSATS